MLFDCPRMLRAIPTQYRINVIGPSQDKTETVLGLVNRQDHETPRPCLTLGPHEARPGDLQSLWR
ncbi:hypothetical protein N7517_004882 [Penicillium concentricum]|uniref:Uncharacterized protein n=1 Tax=Penicillium concentricum TaxID=293559 RepID=A0A9W9S6D1_9EURO|nr:uncharacterized protein N7517_004882 [Penicillium concentricum]KAJ5372876.1 hypothetical protein N7517_004882 [Penicillium concentricum]